MRQNLGCVELPTVQTVSRLVAVNMLNFDVDSATVCA